MDQPPPVEGFAAPCAPTKHGRGFLGVKQIVRLAILAAVVLIGGGVAIVAFVMSRKHAQPHVVFENATGDEVDVQLDGKSIGRIPSNAAKTVQVSPGDHEVAAGSDKGKFTVPDKTGFRGLYAIGGRSHLAVVTVYYATTPGAGTHADKIEPIVMPAGQRLAALPDAMSIEAMELDKPFLESVDVPQGSIETSVVHLCHIREKEDAFVGCPGFAAK
jgi:hypothetical protein